VFVGIVQAICFCVLQVYELKKLESWRWWRWRAGRTQTNTLAGPKLTQKGKMTSV
jgi:hypothetical protein